MMVCVQWIVDKRRQEGKETWEWIKITEPSVNYCPCHSTAQAEISLLTYNQEDENHHLSPISYYDVYLCQSRRKTWLVNLWFYGKEKKYWEKFISIRKPRNIGCRYKYHILSFSSVQSLSHVWLFVTPWIAAGQVSLYITNSRSLPKYMSIESVIPSRHLILCRPLLLLPAILPSIRVFSNESTLCRRWPKYWSFSFNISPFNEVPGKQLNIIAGILLAFLL